MKLIQAQSTKPSDSIERTIIYGETSSGKTWSLKSIPPRFRPVLVLDVDQKSKCLLGQPDFTLVQFDRWNPENTSRQEPSLYVQAKKILTDEPVLLASHKTIVLDSMTLLYGGILDRVRFKNSRDEMDPTTQPDFGVALNLTLNLVYFLIESGKHIILICHEDTTKLAYGGLKGTPALTGQLGFLVPRYFTDLIHAKVDIGAKGPEYKWETKHSRMFLAGTPKDLPMEISQDFAKLWEVEK